MHTTLHDGPGLRHLAVVPDDYEEGTVRPLVLCLHGYGAGMHDLTGLAPLLGPPGAVYLFPDAPLAAFGGIDFTARAWFERGGNESPEAVREALAALDTFARSALTRYPSAGRTLLLGFSQGSALGLRYGLARPEVFAGVVSLSGSLRQIEDLQHRLPASRDQPIFVAHGWRDDIVPCEWSRRLVQYLERQGYAPTFKTYTMGHQITPQLVADLRPWMARVLTSP